MGTPGIGIGLPVYNGERYLPATIQALVKQTWTDWQLIICDNASTDRTEAIARAWAGRDPRIRYVRNRANVGVARNFRLSFELSESPYFRWAAADDLCAPTCLARCVAALEQDAGAVMAYGKTLLIDADGAPIGEHDDGLDCRQGEPSKRLAQVLPEVGLCNAIYGLTRREALGRTRLMGSYLGSDLVLLAELVLQGRFVEIPERLFFRRIHPGAYSQITALEARRAYYNPGEDGQWGCPEWRRFGEYLRAIGRAEISPLEKARCLGSVLALAYSRRQRLLQDMRLSVHLRKWIDPLRVS
jgi:glycosyltransferase involved in cell wall biosynthesis